MNLSLSDKMKQELYIEAQGNRLNAQEYLRLLKDVDDLLNYAAIKSEVNKNGTVPADYDVEGKTVYDLWITPQHNPLA